MIVQFKKEVETHPEIVLDNYELKDGVYIRLDVNKNIKENMDNFTENHLIIQRKNDHEVTKKDLLDWIKIRDYYSSVLNDDMNKAIDLPAKKIHCTNGVTFFMKADIFLGEKKIMSSVQLKEHIDNFYKSLEIVKDRFLKLYPMKAKLKQEKEEELELRDQFFNDNYPDLIEYLESDYRRLLYQKVKGFWENNLEEFVSYIETLKQDSPFSNYVKVFFDIEEETYRKEYQLYVLPKIFNVNNYNEIDNQKIIGLPSSDINMNAKKPFLEFKSMRTLVPNRIPLDEALVLKDLYKWLENQGRERSNWATYQVNYEGEFSHEPSRLPSQYHIRMGPNGSVQFFENVPFRSIEKIDFFFENILGVEEFTNGERFFRTSRNIGMGELRGKISELFFAKRLGPMFLHDEPKVKENVFTARMQSLFYISRQAFYDFFYKGTSQGIWPLIDRVTRLSIEEQISKTVKGTYAHHIAEAFNLRLSLLKYFEIERGLEMGDLIRATIDESRDQINSKDIVSCNSDEQFYFLAGQLSYYLLSQSETANKTFGLFEPILQAKTGDQLKRKLDHLFSAYHHAISMHNLKFKNAFSMVMGYQVKGKIEGLQKDMLLAGLMAKNLFFEKREEAGDMHG